MRRIVTAVIVVAVLAVGGLAYAEGQPADPSVSSTPGAARSGQPGRQLMRGALHGELLVRDPDSSGSTRTIVFDRGKLTSISETSITLKRADGVSVTTAVTPDTRFDGTPRGQLKPGATVVVVGSDGVAERVLSRGAAAEACQARPRLCQRLRPNSEASAGTF